MEELTAEQFIENIKTWQPQGDLVPKVESRLKAGFVPGAFVEGISSSVEACAKATYDYIQVVNGFSQARSLDRKAFLGNLARVVSVMQALEEAGKSYQEVFARYNEAAREDLRQDRFDTQYYDAIQNFSVRDTLKELLKEVEVLLRSFSLVSAELSGVRCLDIYENCVKFQLFLQYLLMQKRLNVEECWSVLFDMNNVFSAPSETSGEELLEELEAFRADLEELRRTSQN